MKYLYNVVPLLFIIFFFSCKDENGHHRIFFQNNSDASVLVDRIYTTADIDLMQALKKDNYWSPKEVLPGKEKYFGIDIDPWEGIFNTLSSTDTMMIVVFDKELFPGDISASCLVAYKLDLLSLNKQNWHLDYPPTDEMLDLGMVVYQINE